MQVTLQNHVSNLKQQKFSQNKGFKQPEWQTSYLDLRPENRVYTLAWLLADRKKNIAFLVFSLHPAHAGSADRVD